MTTIDTPVKPDDLSVLIHGLRQIACRLVLDQNLPNHEAVVDFADELYCTASFLDKAMTEVFGETDEPHPASSTTTLPPPSVSPLV